MSHPFPPGASSSSTPSLFLPDLEVTRSSSASGTNGDSSILAAAEALTCNNSNPNNGLTTSNVDETESRFEPPPPGKCMLCMKNDVDSWDYLKGGWHKTCSDHNQKTDYSISFDEMLQQVEKEVEQEQDVIDLKAGFRCDQVEPFRELYRFSDLRAALKPFASSYAAQLSTASRWHFVYKDAIPTSHGIKFRYTCSQTARNDRPRDGKKGRKTAVKRDGGRVEKFPCGGVATLSFNMREQSCSVHLGHKMFHEPYEKTRVVDSEVAKRVAELLGSNTTEGWLMDRLQEEAKRDGKPFRTTAYQVRRYISMAQGKKEEHASEGEDDENDARTELTELETEKSPRVSTRRSKPSDSEPSASTGNAIASSSALPPPPQPPAKRVRRSNPRSEIVSLPPHRSPQVPPHPSLELVDVDSVISQIGLGVAVDPTLVDVVAGSHLDSSSTTSSTPMMEGNTDDSVHAAMSIILGTNHHHHAGIPTNHHHHLHHRGEGGGGGEGGARVGVPTTDELVQQFQRDSMAALHQATVDATLEAAARQARGEGGV